MTEKEFVDSMVDLLVQLEGVQETIKQLKSDGKEANLDVAVLTNVASAMVKSKTEELQKKSEATLAALSKYA